VRALDCHSLDQIASNFYIIDDDESVRGSLARLLLSADMQATTFGSAEDFLAFLEHAPQEDRAAVGAAILDIHLPGMSGLDLVTFLQRTYPSLRLVLITGSKDPRNHILAARDGVILLQKPFDDADLFAAIAPPDSATPTTPNNGRTDDSASLDRNG